MSWISIVWVFFISKGDLPHWKLCLLLRDTPIVFFRLLAGTKITYAWLAPIRYYIMSEVNTMALAMLSMSSHGSNRDKPVFCHTTSADFKMFIYVSFLVILLVQCDQSDILKFPAHTVELIVSIGWRYFSRANGHVWEPSYLRCSAL